MARSKLSRYHRHWPKAVRIVFILILAIVLFCRVYDGGEIKQQEGTNVPAMDNAGNKIGPVELVVYGQLEEIKDVHICFREQNTTITSPALSGSDVAINVSYGTQIKTLSNNETCFKVIDGGNSTWTLDYSSSNEMFDSFLRVSEFRNSIINPHISVYRKIDGADPVWTFLLCIFYSGIFWYALSRIVYFINVGFKT